MGATQLQVLDCEQKNIVITKEPGEAQWAILNKITPLILDLNGNQHFSQSLDQGVAFDLQANGQAIKTGWVEPGDGLLVLDRNHDGQITDGSELFGSSTMLGSGRRAANGYIALAELDSNHDGFIRIDDPAFADLKVWTDNNANAVSDPGELHTLAERGIQQLNLNASSTSIEDNGNLVGLVSGYQTSDGTERAMADVWLAVEPSAPKPVPVPADLRTGVAGLVDALSAFAASTTLPPPPSTVHPLLATTADMAAVLACFDANGQLLPSTTDPAGRVPVLRRNSGQRDDDLGGVPLAFGKTD